MRSGCGPDSHRRCGSLPVEGGLLFRRESAGGSAGEAGAGPADLGGDGLRAADEGVAGASGSSAHVVARRSGLGGRRAAGGASPGVVGEEVALVGGEDAFNHDVPADVQV
jgi:hypothetical protein